MLSELHGVTLAIQKDQAEREEETTEHCGARENQRQSQQKDTKAKQESSRHLLDPMVALTGNSPIQESACREFNQRVWRGSESLNIGAGTAGGSRGGSSLAG